MVKRLAILLCTSLMVLSASEMEIGIAVHPEISLSEGIRFNALSLFVERDKSIGSSVVICCGADVGVNCLSTYISYHSGLYASLLKSNKILWSAGALMKQGIQFFRPFPLYMFAMGPEMRFKTNISKNTALGLRLSASHVICPAYSQYSPQYTWNELSVGISYGLSGRSQKKKNK